MYNRGNGDFISRRKKRGTAMRTITFFRTITLLRALPTFVSCVTPRTVARQLVNESGDHLRFCPAIHICAHIREPQCGVREDLSDSRLRQRFRLELRHGAGA